MPQDTLLPELLLRLPLQIGGDRLNALKIGIKLLSGTWIPHKQTSEPSSQSPT